MSAGSGAPEHSAPERGVRGDLAQDQIVAFEYRDDQSRTSLGLAEVREGEVEDYNIAFYKLAQAASSSGVSQSFASDDSAVRYGSVLRFFGMPTGFPLSRRKALAIAGYSLGMSRLLPAFDTSEAAPRFSAKTLAGEAFNNHALLGKVVLVEFWATWCPYCRSDAEPLDRLATEFEKDGLVVLAVDMGESKKTVRAFLERNPRKVNIVLMEDTNLAAAFAAHSFPQYVLIDREGHVAGRQNGAGGEAALRRVLRRAGLGSGGDDDGPVELRSSPRRGM